MSAQDRARADLDRLARAARQRAADVPVIRYVEPARPARRYRWTARAFLVRDALAVLAGLVAAWSLFTFVIAPHVLPWIARLP